MQDELNTIHKTIAIFDPNYKVTIIKAKNVRNSQFYFQRGELTKRVLECLKTQPSTINEISEYIFKYEIVGALFVSKFKQNIYVCISKLIQKWILTKTLKNGINIYLII